MKKCNNLDEFAGIIKNKLNLKWQRINKSIFVLFAYNSTGKTQVSSKFNAEKCLCYNSFFEDLLTWNNKNELVFNFNEFNQNIITFMNDQGLDLQINDAFHEFISNKIDVDINFQSGVIFFYHTYSTDKLEVEIKKIKISRSEETLFKFSIFYVLLKSILSDIEENNKDSFFKNYEYVVIDDPISNLDDGNIIKIANRIIELYDNYKNKHKVRFLIETHNTLFLDVLKNNLTKKRTGTEKKHINIYMLNISNNVYVYANIISTQVAYHINMKIKLDKLVHDEFISKSAYNTFRIILEKHAAYMGLSSFSKCLRLNNDEDKEDLIRSLNHYSHGNMTEIEMSYMDNDAANIFKEAYYNFLCDYGWETK